MKVNFVAKRSLVNGHVATNSYDLGILCQAIEISREAKIEAPESLSGRRETLRFCAIERYQVTTFPLAGFDFLLLKEFLDSVEGGDTFTVDPYGAIGLPVASYSGALEAPGYTASRVVEIGTGGQDDYFSVQFTIRVLAS